MPAQVGPANYDAARLRMDSATVDHSAEQLLAAAEEMIRHIKTVADTLAGLELAWAGSSKEEAEALLNRWGTVMAGMFGDYGHKGVLGAMYAGIKTIATGYAETEQTLASIFHNFHYNLEFAAASVGPYSPTSPGQMTDVTDTKNTAITEVWGK